MDIISTFSQSVSGQWIEKLQSHSTRYDATDVQMYATVSNFAVAVLNIAEHHRAPPMDCLSIVDLSMMPLRRVFNAVVQVRRTIEHARSQTPYGMWNDGSVWNFQHAIKQHVGTLMVMFVAGPRLSPRRRKRPPCYGDNAVMSRWWWYYYCNSSAEKVCHYAGAHTTTTMTMMMVGSLSIVATVAWYYPSVSPFRKFGSSSKATRLYECTYICGAIESGLDGARCNRF